MTPDENEVVTVTRVVTYTATRQRMRSQLMRSLSNGVHGNPGPHAPWGIAVEVSTTSCPEDLMACARSGRRETPRMEAKP